LGKKKRLFEVELLDTKRMGSPTIQRQKISGRYQLEAVRKMAKTLPPSINLKEWRDPKKKKHSRYVFMTGEVKVNEC
jgi:hypothetical protein